MLVAAGEEPGLLPGMGGLDSHLRDHLLANGGFAGLVDDAADLGVASEGGQAEVIGNGHFNHQPLQLAILGRQRDAGAVGVLGRGDGHGFVRDAQAATDGRRDAKKGLEQFRAPGADAAGQHHALPGMDLEVERDVGVGRGAQFARLEQDGARGAILVGEVGGQVAAHH